MDVAAPSYGLIEWRSEDGLRLVARIYGCGRPGAVPVVCLPGLTRNARDFERLAEHVSGHPSAARPVIAFDFRGRGQSDWGPPESYTPMTEAADVLAGLAFMGIDRCAVVGTSRGGIVAMLIAAMRGELIERVVLNDIGPRIEPGGLDRVARAMRAAAPSSDWVEAAAGMRATYADVFPGFGDPDWDRLARQLCRTDGDRIVLDYDPRLIRVFDGFDPATFHVDLWPAYASLAAVPLMVVRGALSDLVSPATVEAMRRGHPRFESCVVPDQGHAPVLWERWVLERISGFLADAPLG